MSRDDMDGTVQVHYRAIPPQPPFPWMPILLSLVVSLGVGTWLGYRLFVKPSATQTVVAASSPAAVPPSPIVAEELLVDLVCKRPVNPRTTPYVLEFQGNTLYFDSQECLTAFLKNPVAYARVRVKISVSPNPTPIVPTPAEPPRPAPQETPIVTPPPQDPSVDDTPPAPETDNTPTQEETPVTEEPPVPLPTAPENEPPEPDSDIPPATPDPPR